MSDRNDSAGKAADATGAVNHHKKTHLRSRPLFALVLLLAATAMGCSSTAAEIETRRQSFEPGAIEVEAGTTVTWRFSDGVPHDVTGDRFKSEVKSEGTFTHTFEDPGTYKYTCTLHPGMDGQVIVN